MTIPVYFIGNSSSAIDRLQRDLAAGAAYDIDFQILSCGGSVEHIRNRKGPAIAVLDLPRNAEDVYRFAQEITVALPDVHLVMVWSGPETEAIAAQRQIGAAGLLIQPVTVERALAVFDAVRKSIDRGVKPIPKKAQVIAVCSSKGGVGTTTAATNIAASLAQRNHSVCLADLVLEFGSVISFLNLDPAYTILDAVAAMRRSDMQSIQRSLIKHSSRVRVLAEPFYAEDACRISPADVDEILDVLALSFDFLVIDTPKEVGDILTLVLDKASTILFVTEMNVPAIRSARRAFDLFERTGLDIGKIRLIVNRYVENKIVNLDSVSNALDMKVFWTLPNNYPVVVGAINQGLSLQEADSRSDIAHSYSGLADAVVESFACAETSDLPPQTPAGFFQRWLTAGLRLK